MDEVILEIMRMNYEARRRGVLSVWAIFDHPRDFPDSYVARRFECDAPTGDAVGGDLDALRHALERAGLVYTEEDDPVIVETWRMTDQDR
jgi:hypothetical protein